MTLVPAHSRSAHFPRPRLLATLVCALALVGLSGCGGLLPSEPDTTAWSLDDEASTIRFIGIKNNAVAVPGVFRTLTGGVDAAAGRAWVAIELASLSTGNAGRDFNISNFFFESTTHGRARFDVTGLPAPDGWPAVGESIRLDIEGTLALHGGTRALKLPVDLEQTASGAFRVRTAGSFVVTAKELGLGAQLDKLREVCGHDSLSGAVPVEVDLIFLPADSVRAES